jgi:hypothetical protein
MILSIMIFHHQVTHFSDQDQSNAQILFFVIKNKKPGQNPGNSQTTLKL